MTGWIVLGIGTVGCAAFIAAGAMAFKAFGGVRR